MDIDPREFIVPASDVKGHSDRIWVRIQSGHDRQMSIVLNSKWFPYRSKGDIVRHAIQRHLAWLETLRPVPSVTAQVDSIIEILREDEFNEEVQEVVGKLEEQVGRYLAQGNSGRAKSLISRVIAKIDQMPESEWKDIYRKSITDRYSGLLSGESVNFGGL